MPFLDEVEAAIPALRRYAHGLARDRDAAEDLVQDCLERALSRRGMWRGDGPLKAWLFRILLNCFRDDRRRLASRPRLARSTVSARPGPGGAGRRTWPCAMFMTPSAACPRTSAPRCCWSRSRACR